MNILNLSKEKPDHSDRATFAYLRKGFVFIYGEEDHLHRLGGLAHILYDRAPHDSGSRDSSRSNHGTDQ